MMQIILLHTGGFQDWILHNAELLIGCSMLIACKDMYSLYNFKFSVISMRILLEALSKLTGPLTISHRMYL